MTYARLKPKATEVGLTFPAVVVYDATCAVCTGGMRWVERRALPDEFQFLPCQSPERQARFPWMSEKDCLEALQLVFPDGRVLSGDRAIPEILRRLRGWRWLVPLFRLPGAGVLAPRVYRWVARHRYAIACALKRP